MRHVTTPVFSRPISYARPVPPHLLPVYTNKKGQTAEMLRVCMSSGLRMQAAQLRGVVLCRVTNSHAFRPTQS